MTNDRNQNKRPGSRGVNRASAWLTARTLDPQDQPRSLLLPLNRREERIKPPIAHNPIVEGSGTAQ